MRFVKAEQYELCAQIFWINRPQQMTTTKDDTKWQIALDRCRTLLASEVLNIIGRQSDHCILYGVMVDGLRCNLNFEQKMRGFGIQYYTLIVTYDHSTHKTEIVPDKWRMEDLNMVLRELECYVERHGVLVHKCDWDTCYTVFDRYSEIREKLKVASTIAPKNEEPKSECGIYDQHM